MNIIKKTKEHTTKLSMSGKIKKKLPDLLYGCCYCDTYIWGFSYGICGK